MPIFTSFLQSFSSLSYLKLRLECTLHIVNYNVPIVLQNLELLTIIVGVICPEVLEGFLRILKTPNVRTLRFHQDDDDYEGAPVQEILFPENEVRWPRLERLQLFFSNLLFPPEEEDLPPGRIHPLHYILTRLPRVHDLSIGYDDDLHNIEEKDDYDIPSVRLAVHPLIASGNNTLSLPPLRTLTLMNCRLGTEFLLENRDVFNLPTFENLRIRDKYNLVDMGIVRGLLPSDKNLMVQKEAPSGYHTFKFWEFD